MRKLAMKTYLLEKQALSNEQGSDKTFEAVWCKLPTKKRGLFTLKYFWLQTKHELNEMIDLTNR